MSQQLCVLNRAKGIDVFFLFQNNFVTWNESSNIVLFQKSPYASSLSKRTLSTQVSVELDSQSASQSLNHETGKKDSFWLMLLIIPYPTFASTYRMIFRNLIRRRKKGREGPIPSCYIIYHISLIIIWWVGSFTYLISSTYLPTYL